MPHLIDQLTGVEVELSHGHHETHEGQQFSCTDVALLVQTASPKYWHFKTGAGPILAHVEEAIWSDAPGTWEILEGPTLTDDGTPLNMYNMNRTSSTVPTATIYDDPTVTADGTQVVLWRTGSGGNPSSFSASGERSESEWIFDVSTSYLVKFTPDANDTDALIRFIWYEDIPVT